MTLNDLIRAERDKLAAKVAERNAAQEHLVELRSRIETDESVTEDVVRDAIAARNAFDADVDAIQSRISELEAEQARDDEITELMEVRVDTNVPTPKYDEVARVGAEERTYAAHKEAGFDSRTGTVRRGFRPGGQFERDVAAAFLGDYAAQERLARHQNEERVERGEYLTRAAGTGAFAGLVVPQYLTELYAPAAAARRPFADAIRSHVLPADGMTVNLSRITTSTSTAIQTENNAVSETNIDDTLLSIGVQTNAGQQTLSRQAIERGTGVEAVVLDDLFRQYATVLDSTLINQATNGLVNVATTVTYTDASPTAAELYPKILESLAGVEGALLDQASGENIAVMHSRRWYWMQSQVGTSWPFLAQPGFPTQSGGAVVDSSYGSGVRGVLPNGTAVIVDNNVPVNLGGGTNEDRVFLLDRNECHLWEDPSAPMFIRAEQPAAASLGVLLVVYGYFAYTHARYAHSRQIGGTGLITPTF